MGHYVDRDELIKEQEDYLRTGKISDRYGEMILQIVGGAFGRFARGRMINDRDDYVQQAVLDVLKKLPMIEPGGMFAFATESAKFTWQNMRNKRHAQRCMLYCYAESEGHVLPQLPVIDAAKEWVERKRQKCRDYGAKMRAENPAPPITVTCPCGKSFDRPRKKGTGALKYCSDECRERAKIESIRRHDEKRRKAAI